MLEAFTSLYDVDLVALADPNVPLDTSELQRMCRRVIVVPHPFTFGRHRLRQLGVAARSLLSLEPYRLRKFRSGRLLAVLRDLEAANTYDVVHYEQFGVAPYLNPLYASTITAQNIESEVYRLGVRAARSPVRRLWARVEGAKLRRAEPLLLRRFDEVFVLALDDVALLHDMGVERVDVVPMPAPPAAPPRTFPPSEPLIMSIGSMSWFGVEDGLLWFHDRVLPLVRERVPDAEWELVGPNAGRAILALDSQPGIALRGYVDDIQAEVRRARVGVIPLQIGGGIRMKLLDLMSWGLPCVSTTLGARGLAFGDGEGCFRRDEPEAFAAAVVSLLQDDEVWRRSVKAGRDFVTTQHTLARLRDAVQGGVAKATGRHTGARPVP
jgi:polysaccharide biosynthesis protein PslH